MDQQPPTPTPSPPPDDLSFERIFEEMLDVMKFAVENADKPIKDAIPQDIEARLNLLEKQVNIFCELNDALMDATKESPQANLLDTESLSKQDQRSIERANQLIAEAKMKLKKIEEKEAIDKASGKAPGKPSKKKDAVRERKKKFKKFGQDKNWKPM